MPKFAFVIVVEWDKSQSRLLCEFFGYTNLTLAKVGKIPIPNNKIPSKLLSI